MRTEPPPWSSPRPTSSASSKMSPARQGDLERLHEPDAHGDRSRRAPVVARPRRPAPIGRTVRAPYRRGSAASGRGAWMPHQVHGAEVQGVCARDPARRRRTGRGPGAARFPRRAGTGAMVPGPGELPAGRRHRTADGGRHRRTGRGSREGAGGLMATPLERSAGTRLGHEEDFPLIFELSRPGRRAWSLPEVAEGAPDIDTLIPDEHRRSAPPRLPEVSERDLVRHFTRLSQRNWAIDVGAYPLGSCTMKYNPKVAEDAAALPGFSTLHPLADDDLVQGALELLGTLERALCEATGMARLTFQPAAGAQGELTGLLIMRAHHRAQGDVRKRVIIPDSAHGTNPASVTLAGYQAQEVKSDDRGLVDLDSLRSVLDEDVPGLMLTNPNTLGLFEKDIERIQAMVHDVGGLLYYDGANFNSIVGVVRPGDMGFDIVHLNLHKTFATPHGGGGPASGPLAVSERLERFLPNPVLAFDEGTERWRWDDDRPDSIGRIHSFHGNFGINVRAYAYLRSLGPEGLKRVAERAVLNANYLRVLTSDAFPTAFDGTCMHEYVATAKPLRKHGVRATDVAKRLIDLGYHPPTVYFPLIVEEALMVEPTETESKETVDGLGAALNQIAAEAAENPELLHSAPVTTPVRRPDEAKAARALRVRWTPEP